MYSWLLALVTFPAFALVPAFATALALPRFLRRFLHFRLRSNTVPGFDLHLCSPVLVFCYIPWLRFQLRLIDSGLD